MDDLRERLGKRIRAARRTLGLTQQQLAREAGLPALQVVSQIEKGEREVKAWELVNICRALRVDFGDLLRDEEPAPRAAVLWRQAATENQSIREAEFVQAYERYALLEQLCGQCAESDLPLRDEAPERLSFEQAARMADESRTEFELGSRPAAALRSVLEERYGVQIWHRHLGSEGSAACTRGATGAAMLVNSAEVPGRRNFSIAHELFHLLTWEKTMEARESGGEPFHTRIEQLANVFASALLLPEDHLRNAVGRRSQGRGLVLADLVELAREFDVSAVALLWRLQNLGVLTPDAAEEVRGSDAFRAIDRTSRPASWTQPPDLPERYVRLGFTAYQRGKLSRARLAELLGVGLADLASKLEEYGLDERQNYAADMRTA